MCTQQTLFFIVRDDCDDNKAEQAWVALAHHNCAEFWNFFQVRKRIISSKATR